MTGTIARWMLFGAACCIGQGACAARQLVFWPSGGEHGIDACVFTTMMSPDDPKAFGRLIVGVAADTATLALAGTVKLRHDDTAAIPRRLALGAGTDTLLDVALRPTGAHTVRATLPAGSTKDLMGSLMHRTGLWVRIDGAAAQAVEIGGTDEQVTSCIATLERDLADERSARAHGAVTTAFPILDDDD